VLLPALEKSPEELSNLGKVIIASLKAMMAAGLGDEVEGEFADLIQRKPTNAETPYLCILDEYGYYAVQGFAVVPAQARSLGFSTIFAGQDLPAFQKASKEEAASIGANCNIKIAMKLEDPTDTWDFFSKTAGEAYVTKVDAFQTNAQSVMNHYMDTRSSSSERRARIDLLDLKDQREGEAHIFFKSRIVRAKMFYANPKPVKAMRLNSFLKVDKPDIKNLLGFEKSYRRFKELLQHKIDFSDELYDENEDIDFLSKNIAANQAVSPIERGISALIAYHEHSIPAEYLPEPEDTLLEESELNIFTTMRLTELDMALLRVDDYESFTKPLLDKKYTREQTDFVSRLSGVPAAQSTSVADELIRDMQMATYYPPQIKQQYTGEEMAQLIDELVEHITQRIEAEKNEDDFD